LHAAEGEGALQLVTFERREVPSTHLDSYGSARPPAAFRNLELGRLGRLRLGALIEAGPHAGDVVDVNRALVLMLLEGDHGAPEVEADSQVPSEMRAFLGRGPSGRRMASQALGWTIDALDRYDTPDLIASGALHARRSVSLCAPVTRPGKIIGVADNYPSGAGPAPEAEREPGRPGWFLKPPTSLIGPEDDIVLPRIGEQIDCSGVLAVVIGRHTRRVDAADALDHVAGYTIGNDVVACDLHDSLGSIARSLDGFAPMGPVLVTADAIPNPQDLAIRTRLSGQTRQDGRTKEMILPVAELVAFASELMTLEVGDVLLTGSPQSLDPAQPPARFLKEGDVVDVEIEKIGRLRSYVRSPGRAGSLGR